MKLTLFDGIWLFLYTMIGLLVGYPETAGLWVLGWLGIAALFIGINDKTTESMKDDKN